MSEYPNTVSDVAAELPQVERGFADDRRPHVVEFQRRKQHVEEFAEESHQSDTDCLRPTPIRSRAPQRAQGGP